MKTLYCPNLKKMPASSLFDALSDPVRLEIVRNLLREDEVSCGECKVGGVKSSAARTAGKPALAKSTMSHHFKVLRDAGLITRREVGKVHYLSLRVDEIEARMPGLLDLLRELNRPL
jgi:DNA-binding transcriptional ArsR family regulator